MTTRRGPDRLFFDLWSRFYDAPLVQRITYRPEHDAVLKRLRGTAPGRVLDIACGTGLLGARIGRELPGTRVVGCDFSRGMLEQAARQGRLDCLVQGSALELPFESGAFGAVVTTEAFHWFPDQAQALREFRRVLAPGGRILVSLVNPPLEVISRVSRKLSRRAGEPARWPTRGQMRRLTEDAGFEVESQSLVLRFPGTLLLPSILTVGVRSPEASDSARASGR